MKKIYLGALILCVLLLAGCKGKSYLEQADPEDAQAADESPQAEPERLYVQVCGAVKMPGVYELKQGSRVFQAIELAGGLREDACDRDLNQAQPLADGQKIYVCTQEEAAAGETAPEGEAGGGGSGGGSEDGKVHLNTAGLEELMTLPGIGESKAKLILSYREEHGSFAAPEDLMQIRGIKEGVYNKIKDRITVY